MSQPVDHKHQMNLAIHLVFLLIGLALGVLITYIWFQGL